MQINNNLSSMKSCNKLKKNSDDKTASAKKLTSGFRINKAADDAAGLGLSEKLRMQIKGLDQASVNTQDGVSMVQTIEGATTEVQSILNRMSSLAMKSANGINQEDDRKLIDKEVQQLKDEIDRIAKETEFNGKKVLDGSFGSNGQRLDLMVGENPGFIISFKPIESIATDSLKIDSLNVLTQNDAIESIDKINYAINDISARRIEIGSVGNRLMHSVKSVDNNVENITASESRIRDADMAKEAMESVKSDILMNSTESMLVTSNHNPEYVLKLLKS